MKDETFESFKFQTPRPDHRLCLESQRSWIRWVLPTPAPTGWDRVPPSPSGLGDNLQSVLRTAKRAARNFAIDPPFSAPKEFRLLSHLASASHSVLSRRYLSAPNNIRHHQHRFHRSLGRAGTHRLEATRAHPNTSREPRLRHEGHAQRTIGD